MIADKLATMRYGQNKAASIGAPSQRDAAEMLGVPTYLGLPSAATRKITSL